MSLLNEAKMPSLKDKVDALEEARLAEEAEKPKKKAVKRKKKDE